MQSSFVPVVWWRIQQLTKQNGPYLANRVMRHVRAAWNTALKEHELPANPTIAVHWNKEHRRQEPIPWASLPAWWTTVSTLRPIIEGGKRECIATVVRKSFGVEAAAGSELSFLLDEVAEVRASPKSFEYFR